MLFSFLVTVREGLEIALIVTILLGYLRSVQRKEHFRKIWVGVALASALSVGIGAGLKLASHELDGRVREAFEGFTMLFAVAVLTWMLFWMKGQSAGISRELREKVDIALSGGSLFALSVLAFSAVAREGLETALFLFAGSSTQASEASFVAGGVLGFAVAGGAGAVLYYGAARLPIKQFFLASGVVLIVLAAGLLSNALTALHEATIIPDLGQRPWDTEGFVSMTSSVGKFSHTILGYDSAPAISQIALYWGYLVIMVAGYALLPLPKLRRPSSQPALSPRD